MPVVVATDYTIPSLEIEETILRAGVELRAGYVKAIAAIKSLVADADAVITQFAPINAEVITAMQRAKVIVRYGIGYDDVDVKATRERGILVCNVPDYCIDEVADHTWAFVLGVTRQVVPNALHVRNGKRGLVTRRQHPRLFSTSSPNRQTPGCGSTHFPARRKAGPPQTLMPSPTSRRRASAASRATPRPRWR